MKKGIAIELTSLLDVIMIILFMVLVSAQQSAGAMEKDMQEAMDSAREAEQIAAEMQEEAARVITSYEMMDETCGIITITITEDRLLMVSDGESTETLQLTWDERQYARNSFKAFAVNMKEESLEKGKQAVFMMFQYDSTKIYNKDYELVHGVLLGQAGESVYIAEYDIQNTTK